jgi:hypothetical protein
METVHKVNINKLKNDFPIILHVKVTDLFMSPRKIRNIFLNKTILFYSSLFPHSRCNEKMQPH